ncbi:MULTISPECIES: sensor histidine kinase [Actinokineospora]|uniref:histidine kinase n=1 Tax=Actinokineospora fastidiosa TaxID=1816 RepID=A0A918GTE2_9PSEU|nr:MULTISPECIES: HAMP domain-containing sensor histidine kinase [Actinokineospora]UVS79275.1 Sensor protein KdpD [Actinokineospora sp. UTMC 2448]GGS60138.1 hypothetical protein GCM10010171_63830 [Actinokineospora fastidiosa]
MRPRSAADRLRRLRLVLTVLFTVLNTAGLIVLAVVIVDTDRDRGRDRIDAELHRVTSVISRLLVYVDGTMHFSEVKKDTLNDRCPRFAVVSAGAATFPTYTSPAPCPDVPAATLAGYAREAVDVDKTLSAYEHDVDGDLVLLFAEPVRAPTGQYIGAVIAWADAEAEEARHDGFTLLVAGGCLLTLLLLAGAGHVLSGRAIKPAVTALSQQEVLLAETAHDLRTPIAALRALAESALRNPEQSPELLPRTVRLAGRMGGIIDSLLVRARLAAGVDDLAIQPIWLDQLVSVVVDETPADGASITLTAAPTQVMADPGLVQRAIGNLLDNALRHGRQPYAKAVVHITVAGGRVTVADHGPGVDPALAAEVFDRFRTGSGSTGLGLAIVRWVAQAHGGALNVYNADEGGAIFELVLPPR